jgi:hypothetical protein
VTADGVFFYPTFILPIPFPVAIISTTSFSLEFRPTIRLLFNFCRPHEAARAHGFIYRTSHHQIHNVERVSFIRRTAPSKVLPFCRVFPFRLELVHHTSSEFEICNASSVRCGCPQLFAL